MKLVEVKCGSVALLSTDTSMLFAGLKDGLNHVVTVNAEILFYAHEDPFMGSLLRSTVNTIDGRVLQWICQLMYPQYVVRQMAGSAFIYDLAEYCEKHGESIFLLGASERSNQEALKNLCSLHPRLRIEGMSPPFTDKITNTDWNIPIQAALRRFKPVHLIVCFGPVKQEKWIFSQKQFLEELGIRCAYGMGGTLDFVAGTKPRAPVAFQKLGLEWLFRFLLEPRERFWRTLRMFKMPLYAALTVKKSLNSSTASGKQGA